jgi:hypothetical protein
METSIAIKRSDKTPDFLKSPIVFRLTRNNDISTEIAEAPSSTPTDSLRSEETDGTMRIAATICPKLRIEVLNVEMRAKKFCGTVAILITLVMEFRTADPTAPTTNPNRYQRGSSTQYPIAIEKTIGRMPTTFPGLGLEGE